MILSIETSTEVCSIALHQDGALIAEDASYESYSHAERLAPMISALLENNKIPKSKLSAIAVSAGPGSYTGLRIGTSTAKGLCFALDIPLLSVNTLESMLVNLPDDLQGHYKCPMIDARRMEVYCLLADGINLTLEEINAKIIDSKSFEEELRKHKILFYGNGASKCKEVILSENAIFLDGITPHARNIGQLAWQYFTEKKYADLAYFEPEYLKPYLAIKAKDPFR